MHGATGDVPHEVIDDINLFNYRQRMHLSYEDAMNEPNEEVERAFLIWSLERQRDLIEAKRQQSGRS